MTYNTGKRLVVPTALFLAIAIPLSVHAGFFAALAGIFPETSVEASEPVASSYNAQSVPLLKAAIHSDPNPAKGGGDIVISEDGALVAGGDVTAGESVNKHTANGEISVYVVRQDDDLSHIAEMFNVSVNTIMWANNIKKASLIKPGMELVILPITGVQHVVKKGEKLSSIVEKYEGDLEEVLSYNQLASADDIKEGDVVMIPGGIVEAAATPTKAPSSSSTSRGSVAVATGSGSSNFANPLPGAIRTQGIHGYNGVDLAAGAGSSILAAAAGDVIVAKDGGAWNGGYGNYIVIKHANGTQTLYAHLSAVSVAVGQSVSAGEPIGIIGNTGRSTGTHLHFEVRGARNPF